MRAECPLLGGSECARRVCVRQPLLAAVTSCSALSACESGQHAAEVAPKASFAGHNGTSETRFRERRLSGRRSFGRLVGLL